MEKTTNSQGQQPVAASKPLVQGVHCNYIPVADVKQAKEWYMRVLGVTQVRPEGGIVVLGNGQWLFLIESKDRPNANFTTDDWNETKGFEMFSLTFATEDIVALHESLRQHGAEVEPIVDYGPCGLQFLFKDPDGNRFNVWQVDRA
ncbi:VOC family protein [Paenibacillus kobensis]|uniref:VOC family protein n=1 Tax=Paenibacillus kobensis TaxID=59841 RepID=UPI000FD9943B|nr:VOC family protein [Paenibacillus kobensis]